MELARAYMLVETAMIAGGVEIESQAYTVGVIIRGSESHVAVIVKVVDLSRLQEKSNDAACTISVLHQNLIFATVYYKIVNTHPLVLINLPTSPNVYGNPAEQEKRKKFVTRAARHLGSSSRMVSFMPWPVVYDPKNTFIVVSSF